MLLSPRRRKEQEMPAYRPTDPPINQSTNQPINQSTNQPTLYAQQVNKATGS